MAEKFHQSAGYSTATNRKLAKAKNLVVNLVQETTGAIRITDASYKSGGNSRTDPEAG